MAVRPRGAGFTASGSRSRSFVASVTKATKGAKVDLAKVFKMSVQQVAMESRIPIAKGGNMPVKTGNLRRSQTASLKEMPTVADGKTKFNNDGGTNVAAVIFNAEPGDKIYIAFRAIYARVQEARYGFVGLTAQRWSQIVRENITLLKGKSRNR